MKRMLTTMLFLIMFTCTCTPATEIYTQPTLQVPTLTPAKKEISDELFLLTINTRTPDKTEIVSISTATPPPPNPYVFDSLTGRVDASIGSLTIEFHEGALKGVKLSTKFVTPLNPGENPKKPGAKYDNTSDPFYVGSGISILRAETKGNLLLTAHSGYNNSLPLEAEPYRFYLENEEQNRDYVLLRILESIGSKGTLTINNVELEVEALGGVRLEHEESEELLLNPEGVLEIATRKIEGTENYIALGNAEDLEYLKEGKHELIINFCGWGPNKNYSYYRYIMALEVKEVTTPVNQ